MTRWSNVKQWFYPSEFRIEVGDTDATAALLAATLAEAAARLAVPAGKPAPTAIPDEAAAPPPAGALDKSFVVDLCNKFHLVSRSTKPFQDVASSDATRMKRSLEQLRKALLDNGIDCVDLAGQGYDPGRLDFEQLGEPQSTPGLTRMTIIQCERPLIMLNGKLIQRAKGIVGRPAE